MECFKLSIHDRYCHEDFCWFIYNNWSCKWYVGSFESVFLKVKQKLVQGKWFIATLSEKENRSPKIEISY